MNFDWEGFHSIALQLAGVLPGATLEEAALRTAISRAYYAAFHKARQSFLGQSYIFPQRRDTHEEVIFAIERSETVQARRAAIHLRNLKDLRHRADYDDTEFPRLRDNSQLALRYAREVLQAC
jgi:uncharacterized protein (UPF0332 family)